jgi:hypothetical protein
VDQEATVPHTVPCGEGTAAFEGVMRELGLEVPTGNDDHDYDDPDSYSDGDDADADDDDDDDDDSSARASKTARLASSDGDGEMDAAPAAGDAVAVVVAWLLIPVRGLRVPMRSATTMRSANRLVPVLVRQFVAMRVSHATCKCTLQRANVPCNVQRVPCNVQRVHCNCRGAGAGAAAGAHALASRVLAPFSGNG